MLRIAFNILISIKSKLVFAFLVMGLLVASVGTYAYLGISDIGKVVEETYDRPLMAINYSRSASQVFSRLDNRILKEAARIADGKPADFQAIEYLIDTFESDMDIVEQRSISQDASPFIQETRALTKNWTQAVLDVDTLRHKVRLEALEQTSEKIFENLDIIVELQTNESFLSREAAIQNVSKIGRYNLFAAISAILLAIILAAWLALTILKPLKTAVDVAQKVTSGRFDAAIPQGRRDETGLLLKSMTVMQNSIRNLVARERNERTLAQSRLSAALENSKDAVLIANAQGIITVANSQIADLFPFIDPTSLIGLPLVEFFNYGGHPVRMSVETYSHNNEMRFEDGRWALINASAMQEGGRLFIWTDITELKQREVNLRIAKEKAEAASHAKTMFLASMSHELRTPLNAIIGFSEMMKKQMLGPLGSDKYVELSGHVLQSGNNLLRMVEDVLIIAQTKEDEADSLDIMTIDIQPLIEAEILNLRESCKTRNIGIIWSKPESQFITQCDPKRFSRIIENILSNAVRFNNPDGFVKLELKALGQGWAALDITDTGVGIETSDIERILAPFVQVDNSHSRAFDGAGLGLTLARQWLELHGGKLSIVSEFGKGTVVRIAFPADVKEIENSQSLSIGQLKSA